MIPTDNITNTIQTLEAQGHTVTSNTIPLEDIVIGLLES